MGTRALWNIYPASVRHWIRRHGGLSRRMIYLQGRALHRIVPLLRRRNAGKRAHTATRRAAAISLHTRKRRQRPPLAPSRRRRARRSARPARPTSPSPRPWSRRARSRDSLARWRPARPARCARQSRARRDASRRTTARAAIAPTAARPPADRSAIAAPAQARAGGAHHQQHGRPLQQRRQPPLQREQHDLGDDAERPQRRRWPMPSRPSARHCSAEKP